MANVLTNAQCLLLAGVKSHSSKEDLISMLYVGKYVSLDVLLTFWEVGCTK